jgi:NitT/TauT family transport system substrate-binding protein
MNPTKSKRFAFFVAGALALSACGASSSDDTDPASSEPVEIVEVEGCEDAVFQPEFDEGKGPTRCQPGTPAPQPLEDKAEITFAIPTNKIATTYILSMAEALGEFDKENIDLTIETVPSVDALQLVADGKIDGFASSTSVGAFNAVAQGFDVRMIVGDGWQSPESKMGVWARKGLETADFSGLKIASAVGVGSSVNKPFQDYLATGDVKLTDLTWETVGPEDTATALKKGAVDAAVLLDPFWLQLEDDPDFEFVVPTAEPGDNIGGVQVGPKLLERRDVALAFTRAYIRTINTYFKDENWQDDDELMDAMSAELGLPAESLRAVPGQIYNWDIPEGPATALQELYISTGTMQGTDPLPESDFIDRSFIAQVVGQERP